MFAFNANCFSKLHNAINVIDNINKIEEQKYLRLKKESLFFRKTQVYYIDKKKERK